MSSKDPPKFQNTTYADYSEFFNREEIGGRPNPHYRGSEVLFCKNCGHFVTSKDSSQHDEWHRKRNFEELYREKVLGEKVPGRKVA